MKECGRPLDEVVPVTGWSRDRGYRIDGFISVTSTLT